MKLLHTEKQWQRQNKIDVLTDALLSNEVSSFIKEKYNGIITCDKTTQIDLRNEI